MVHLQYYFLKFACTVQFWFAPPGLSNPKSIFFAFKKMISILAAERWAPTRRQVCTNTHTHTHKDESRVICQ